MPTDSTDYFMSGEAREEDRQNRRTFSNDNIETVPPAPVETGLATIAPAQTGVLFSVTETTIKKFEEYRLFKVTDIHDKAQVKELQAKKMELVKARTSVNATRKTMNDPYKKIIEENNAKGKFLIETLEPIETHLTNEQERVEKAIEEERVAAANALFKKRSESLEAIGMAMPEGLIRSSSDEVFEEHMMLLRAQAAERDRLEQQRKDQEAAAALLKAEQEAEAARLQAEQEERDRIERDRQEAERKEADRLRQEEAEKLRLEREDLDRQKEELRKQQEADAEELRLAREELDRLREDARKEREDRERQQREVEDETEAFRLKQNAPVQTGYDPFSDPANKERIGEIIEFLNDGPQVAPEVVAAVESSAVAFGPLPVIGTVVTDKDGAVLDVAESNYDTESPQLYSSGSDFNVTSPRFPDPSNTPEVEAKLANYTEQWLVQREFRMSEVRAIPFPMGMIDGMIDRIAGQDAELLKLRKILAHVPAKTAIKAKEKAGYGDEVTTSEAG